jgi:hypothetical protein
MRIFLFPFYNDKDFSHHAIWIHIIDDKLIKILDFQNVITTNLFRYGTEPVCTDFTSSLVRVRYRTANIPHIIIYCLDYNRNNMCISYIVRLF